MLPLALSLLFLAGPVLAPDADALDAYAKKLSADEPSFERRLETVARDSLGIQYHDGPLGEGPDGKHDQDPLMDFARADCVTFVEQSVALAASSSYEETFARLQAIRYAGGVADFEHRNHFFVSDWIGNNAFVQDITGDLGVATGTVDRTISRRDFFELVKAPGLGHDTPDRLVSVDYIPVSMAKSAASKIDSPALVVFVGKVDWLFALHCGLYLEDADGTRKLFHASSRAGEVVAVDLAQYMKEQSERYLGFTVYRIGEP